MVPGGAVQRAAPSGEWTVADAHQSGVMVEIMGSLGEQLLAKAWDEQLGEVEGRHVLAGGRLEG
jgi:hypothetical protein